MSESLITLNIEVDYDCLPEWVDPDDAKEFIERIEEEVGRFSENVLALQRKFEKLTQDRNDGCTILKFGGPS